MLALIAGLVVTAAPVPPLLPGPPARLTATTPVTVGEDGRVGVAVVGGRLVSWDLDSGKRRAASRLPRASWSAVSLAPRTGGQTERALVLADRRALLVHVATGRRIADWSVAPASGAEPSRAATWTPDGRRVGLAGWELPGLRPGEGTPVVWVDAETGTVVSELRMPERTAVLGMGALGDDGAAVVATPRHLVVLGPGPDDARTIGIACEALVGVGREGVIVLERGALVIVGLASGAASLARVATVRGPIAVEAAAMVPGGRWAVARARGAVIVFDLATRRVTTLSEAALVGSASAVAASPTLMGVVVVGRRARRLDLATAAPAELLLAEMCVRGDCVRGEGAWLDLARGRSYRGSFVRGKPSGSGVMHFEDGTIYTGAFEDGLPHGRGRVVTPAGDEHEVSAERGRLTRLP